MNKKIKNMIVVGSFIIILYGLLFINIFTPDKEISYSERRTLAKKPKGTISSLLDGDYFEDYEKYLLDQFVFREEFRSLKTITSFDIFHKKDNNGIYLIDNGIYKIDYPLRENSIINASNKFNEINDRYLSNMNVNYAVIPDKSYFVAESRGYLSIDDDRLVELMNQNIKNMNYIDLYKKLDILDYYKTDIHWKQNKIEDIARYLYREMGNDDEFNVSYEEKSLYPFYGSYYGQAAIKENPDSLDYLTNRNIEESKVYDHVDDIYSKVYVLDRFSTVDPYDFFLSGAKSIISIINNDQTKDKNLIIFRDSFGSSIAPLMLSNYSKITLIDLRYIKTDYIENYIDFSDYDDVLFLFSTQVLNNSYMLK